MIPYIFHVSILIICFYGFYQLFLTNETFFDLNRWVLLGTILLAFLIPMVEIPAEWAILDKEYWLIEEEVGILANQASAEISTEEISSTSELSDRLESESSQMLKEPVVERRALNISLPQILWYIYLFGLAVFGINLLIQLGTLLFQILSLPSLKEDGFRIVELAKDQPPYSFLNCIFINPVKYDWTVYNQIIEHEKVHIRQGHTIDMLLAELLVVFQWFNPAAWQYRKLIENNLEFLTDMNMLAGGINREAYQLNLLKVSVPQYPIGLAMNYNQSILKKRITMMNKKKSSVRSSWKYLTLLPILGLSILLLNNVKAQDESIEDSNNLVNLNLEEPDQKLPQSLITTNEEQGGDQTQTAERTETEQVEVPTVETPAERENHQEKGEDQSSTLIQFNPIGGDKNKIKSTWDKLLPPGMKGFWQAEMDATEICIKFDNSSIRKGHSWTMIECFELREFANPPKNGVESFQLKREAGEITFKGSFEDDYGHGRYAFVPSESFKKSLSNSGYSDLDDELLLQLFLRDVNQAYFQYLKQNGLDNLSKKQLMNFVIHGLDLEYLKENLPILKNKGLQDISPDKLVNLKIHGVSADYIEEMANVGFTDLSLEQLTNGKIHGVAPEYVKEIRSLGYTNLVFKDFINFRIHGVNKKEVDALASLGFGGLSANEITNARIHGISVDYINRLKSVGYEFDRINDLINFKIHGVDVEFIERMNDLGFNNLSPQEVINARIHNVSARFIEELVDLGYKDISIKQAINFSIHNVKTSYIKGLAKLGYGDLPIESLINGKIHNISLDFIEGYQDLGFKDIPFKKLINLKIHNVSPSFIKRAQEKGMTDLSLEEYQKLKIHGILK